MNRFSILTMFALVSLFAYEFFVTAAILPQHPAALDARRVNKANYPISTVTKWAGYRLVTKVNTVTKTVRSASTITNWKTVNKISTSTKTRDIPEYVTKTESITASEINTIKQTEINTELLTAIQTVTVSISPTLLGSTSDQATRVGSLISVPKPPVSSTAAACTPLSNAILNPSFETPLATNSHAPASWSLYSPPGTSNQVTDNNLILLHGNTVQQPHDGSYLLRASISPSMPGDTYINFSQTGLDVCPGLNYTLIAWTRNDKNDSNCVAKFYLGDEEVMSSPDAAHLTVVNDWVESKGYWTNAVEQTVDLVVTVVCDGLIGTAWRTLWLDSMALTAAVA